MTEKDKIIGLTMTRIISDAEATLGVIKTPWGTFATCEDERRDVKVAGETRIPSGTYEIVLRQNSPMADRYRARFGDNHKGIPWLQGVPGFKWVYIHVGNTEKDSAGCILVGRHGSYPNMAISQSTDAYKAIQKGIQEALDSGAAVHITVTDSDVRI